MNDDSNFLLVTWSLVLDSPLQFHTVEFRFFLDSVMMQYNTNHVERIDECIYYLLWRLLFHEFNQLNHQGNPLRFHSKHSEYKLLNDFGTENSMPWPVDHLCMSIEHKTLLNEVIQWSVIVEAIFLLLEWDIEKIPILTSFRFKNESTILNITSSFNFLMSVQNVCLILERSTL